MLTKRSHHRPINDRSIMAQVPVVPIGADRKLSHRFSPHVTRKHVAELTAPQNWCSPIRNVLEQRFCGRGSFTRQLQVRQDVGVDHDHEQPSRLSASMSRARNLLAGKASRVRVPGARWVPPWPAAEWPRGTRALRCSCFDGALLPTPSVARTPHPECSSAAASWAFASPTKTEPCWFQRSRRVKPRPCSASSPLCRRTTRPSVARVRALLAVRPSPAACRRATGRAL